MSKTILAEPQAVETVEVEPPEHPSIVRIAGVLGGEPVIRGTRVPVRAIALHYKAGETIDEILEAYPHLPPAAVVDAMTRIRLLIDEDVSKGPELAAALRRRGFDAVAIQEIGRSGLRDEEQLTLLSRKDGLC